MRILKRGRAFAQLTARLPTDSGDAPVKPDIMAQLDEVWGDRIFSMEEVETMREAERAEDRG